MRMLAVSSASASSCRASSWGSGLMAALEYICRKNATCMVYAYGSKNRQDPDRLAAAQLFAGLKLPFQPGGKAPAVRDIIIKLRGAH